MHISEIIPRNADQRTIFNGVNFLQSTEAQVSFAQHSEDTVMAPYLENRRQQRLKEGKNGGIYVDFGAHHPSRYSNTFWLYLSGWRGICVEPNPDCVHAFKTLRPEDKLLSVAVGITPGKLRYRRYTEPAYNKVIPADDTDYIDEAGAPMLDEMEIDAIPPNDIIAMAQQMGEVDLISIDIEGLDELVLKAIDLKRFRPHLICAEIPAPRVFSADFQSWLKEANYSFFCQCVNSVILRAEE